MFTPHRHTAPVSCTAARTGWPAGLLLCLALAPGPLRAADQPAPTPRTPLAQALQAADPATPSAPPTELRLPPAPTALGPEPSAERRAALAAWQQANERVAAFPRGHIDILRWEAAQTGAAASRTNSPAGSPAPFGALLAQALDAQPAALAPPGLGVTERRQRQAALADRVRQLQGAWLQAIAARARLQRATDVLENARTGAELGRRMVVAGNWSPMKHLAELQTETRARQAWLQAQLAERSAMEQLGRLLGLWQAAQIDTLRQQLPTDLPAAPPAAPVAPAQGVESAVLSAHPLLDTARAQVARLQRGGEPAPAWLLARTEANTLAADRAEAAGGPLQLPELTDARQRNDHRSAHAAEAGAELLRQAADRRSQAREAWAALQTHQALARLTQDLDLPQQEALEQAVLQRYNGMFVSTWELLAAARERLAALDRLTDARLAYWQAEADWRALLAGGEYAGAQSANSPSTPGGNAAPGH